MSKKIEFYTISVHNSNGVTNYPVDIFLKSINERMLDEEKECKVVREIGDKLIRVFPYLYSLDGRRIVIPLGKLKDKNKPYGVTPDNQLEKIDRELYDINSLAYDVDYNIMVFTTNKEGPQIQSVEKYFNTFIPDNIGLSIKIEPLFYNAGIEKVRNAKMVKSVTFVLNLGQPLNRFYLEKIKDYDTTIPILQAFSNMAEAVKNDINGKTLSLTLGLGRSGNKEVTLDLDSMLYLLENININADFVTEIRVNYKDDSDEKIDLARLKQSQLMLSYFCACKDSQVSPEILLGNINDAIAAKIVVITRHIREYFDNVHQYGGGIFDIVTNLHEK